MTVRDLMEQLSRFSPNTEVTACWDCIPDWAVHGVVAYDGRAVLDVSSSETTAEEMAEYDAPLRKGVADR